MTRGPDRLQPRAAKRHRAALIVAPLVTCALVGAGILLSAPVSNARVDFSRFALNPVAAAAAQSRIYAPSRSAHRTAVAPKAVGARWTTAALDLRLRAVKRSAVVGQLPALTRVPITGVHRRGFAQVLIGGQVRWVTASYLVARKPAAQVRPAGPAGARTGGPGLVDRPCPGTAGTEYRLTPAAVRVYRAVCNNFPQITQYGGYAPRGEHSNGHAVDIMTTDVALGTRIADFLVAHAAELGLFDVIWRQHIWTPVRAAEGWRLMPDEGSITANHFNHVHVSVN